MKPACRFLGTKEMQSFRIGWVSGIMGANTWSYCESIFIIMKKLLITKSFHGCLLFLLACVSAYGANPVPHGRTFEFDFNRGPMKSRLFPQAEGQKNSASENPGFVLQPKFAEGME